MNESKYTPGPWIAEMSETSTGGYFTIRGSDNEIVCHIGLTEAQDEADAKLIAAAPELLAACEMILALEQSGRALHPIEWKVLTVVVAKARS